MHSVAEIFRNRFVQVIAFIVFVVVVLSAGKLSADATARAYQDSFATWKSDLPALQQRTQAAVFSTQLIIGRQETQAEYDAQNNVCKVIQTMADDANADRLTPGALGSHVFGWLSGTYGDAKRQSDERAKTFSEYNQTVKQQFAVLKNECVFYVDRTALGVQRAANAKKVEAVADKPGIVQQYANGEIMCASQDGCIPADPAKIPSYIDAYRTTEVDYAQKNIDLYKKQCAQTFVKPVCGAYTTYFEKLQSAHENLLSVIDKWKNTTGNSEVIAASQAVDDTIRNQGAEVKAKFAAAFPDADMEGSFEAKKLQKLLQASEAKIAESTATLTKL
jgi:hypothetical protein